MKNLLRTIVHTCTKSNFSGDGGGIAGGGGGASAGGGAIGAAFISTFISDDSKSSASDTPLSVLLCDVFFTPFNDSGALGLKKFEATGTEEFGAATANELRCNSIAT